MLAVAGRAEILYSCQTKP